MIVTLPNCQELGPLDQELIEAVQLDGRECNLIPHDDLLPEDIGAVLQKLFWLRGIPKVEWDDMLISYSLGGVAKERVQRPFARKWHKDGYNQAVIACMGALPTEVVHGNLDLEIVAKQLEWPTMNDPLRINRILYYADDEALLEAGASINPIPLGTAVDISGVYHRCPANDTGGLAQRGIAIAVRHLTEYN